MKVLVTGGSGFVGGAIVKELEKTECDITIFGLHSPKYKTDARFVQGDILDTQALADLGKYEIIFHLAGVLGTSLLFDDVRRAETVNVMGTINILEMQKHGGVVIQSNLREDWLNPYMISKHTAENYGLMYRQEYPVRYISMRLPHIYGPGQSMEHAKAVPTFIAKALAQEPLPVYGNGEHIMRLLFVRDIAKIMVYVGCRKYATPSIVEVGSLQEENRISVYRLATKIIAMTESSSRIEPQPMRRGQPRGVVDDCTSLDQSKWIWDEARVKETPLDVGLQQTIDYYKHQMVYAMQS